MKQMKNAQLYVLAVAILMSACAPDRNVVSDEERLNIMCSTKKKDRDERCLSDEVRMDSRDVSVILAQKLNREISLQSKILFQNKNSVLKQSQPALNKKTQIADQKLQDKRALTWTLDHTSELDETSGLLRPSMLSSKTMAKDLSATLVDSAAQTFDVASVFGALNNSVADLLSLSRADAKEVARGHGVFSLVQEQLVYSMTGPTSPTELDLQWTGDTQAIFSSFDKKSGKHYFSRDQIAEAGRLNISMNDTQEVMIQKMNFQWNLAPRKDAVLNYSVDLIGTAKAIQVEGGCLRVVGEFVVTNTNDGVKKKPLKTFVSKLVLTEKELNLYGTNKDGSFNMTKSVKKMELPQCSEDKETLVDFGRVL